MKKTFKVLVMTVSVFVLLAISLPYLKAEYLSLKHGKEFEGLELQTNMLNKSRYYKVIEYSDKKASVFYVSDTGDILTFIKNDDGLWELDGWKTVWSKSGSADSFSYPYYR